MRNFHTLWIGGREVFVDHIRRSMSETRAHRIDVSRSSGAFDMTGGASTARRPGAERYSPGRRNCTIVK